MEKKNLLLPEYVLELKEFNKPYLHVINEHECSVDLCKNYENIVEFLNEVFRLSSSGVERAFLIAYTYSLEPIGIMEISRGTASECIYSNREIAIAMLLMGAENFSVIHNHPNGSLKSSQDDIDRMNSLMDLSQILDLDFNESIIVSKKGFYLIRGDHLCKED